MTDIPGKEPIRLFEEQPRWELLPVLAWIVSRDIGQAFLASAKGATMQAVDLALAEFQTAAGEPPCGSVAEAWAGHLVPKLRRCLRICNDGPKTARACAISEG